MYSISSTEFKNNFGKYLTIASKENIPVTIKKFGKPVAVLLSTTDYNRYLDIDEKYNDLKNSLHFMNKEDLILLPKAEEAIKNGFLSDKESEKWFNKLNKEYHKLTKDEENEKESDVISTNSGQDGTRNC